MKRAIMVAVASLLFLSRMAQGADLLGVYEDALKADPAIREAEANRRAARESRPQAWSQLLPQINGNLSKSRTESDGTDPVRVVDDAGNFTIVPFPSESTIDSKGYSVELRQSLFSWSNWATLKRSSHEVAQAEADYQAAEQDLILRVSQRYFDVLSARDNVDAEAAALEAISRQLDQANKRFEVGLIAITDVQEAKAARDSASAAVIAAKRNLATAEELLREYTDIQYPVLARPSESMPLQTPTPADPERWVETSMAQNLALISSRLASDIARDNVGIARGGHFPSIDLVASRSDLDVDVDQTTTSTGIPLSNTFPNDAVDDRILLQINVPIFSGGLTQSQVRQSQFRWIAAKERFTRVSRETERAARDAYLGVLSETARVNALKQALESSQTALKATEAGYEVGTRTAVDVLTSRQTLVRAQTDYARSRYEYILNVIRLNVAAGNLDRNSVTEINQWLTTTEPSPAAQPQPTNAPPVTQP